MPRHDAFLDPAKAEKLSKQELTKMVRRLMSSGKTSEEVKEWFVAELPVAMRAAAAMGLRIR